MNTTTTPDDHLPESDDNAPTPEPQTDSKDSQKIWLRLLFMVILVLLYGVSRVVVSAVVILQFFWVLFTESPNNRLCNLGQSLATYTYQIVRYLTFNTEDRPFPFDEDWPTGAST